MCARGRKARWAAACRHLPALVVGYAMLGNIPARDLPALAVILAFALVERVVESRWLRWVAAALVAMVTAGAIVGSVAG